MWTPEATWPSISMTQVVRVPVWATESLTIDVKQLFKPVQVAAVFGVSEPPHHLCRIPRDDRIRRVFPRADRAESDDAVPPDMRPRQQARPRTDPHILLQDDRRGADRAIGVMAQGGIDRVEVGIQQPRIRQNRARSHPDELLTAETGAVQVSIAADLDERVR